MTTKVFLLSAAACAICAAIPAGMHADRTVTASAYYYAPLTMPPAIARQEAVNQAQLEAIRKEFGSSLSQANFTFMEESHDGSREDFYMIGESDVMGEWIETIGDTTVNVTHNAHDVLYEVRLKGRIREIPSGRADIEAKLLFNGTDKERDAVRNFTYHTGDYLYIYFTSPVDGYLAAYLGDDDPQMTMQCLVPYDGMADGVFPIEAGKEYVLFSKEEAPDTLRPLTRRLKMNARKETDINQIYLIFSPNKFVKAADTADRSRIVSDSRGNEYSLLPRHTTFERFQKWLGRSRRHDKDMQVIKYVVSIKKI